MDEFLSSAWPDRPFKHLIAQLGPEHQSPGQNAAVSCSHALVVSTSNVSASS